MSASDEDEVLDLAAQRARLEQDRESRLAQVERLSMEAADEAWHQPKPDETDQGSEAVERERLRSLADRARADLRAIDEALERIDEGNYGTCVDCGDAIAPARLQARPEALTCVSCQQRRRQAS
ncbi:TraR/DksA family transcriptional regulator [Egibacter rhizosphaerae]|nr:TraR/DksA family transcriptional regulator [Egibacter rhizosphaerae]